MPGGEGYGKPVWRRVLVFLVKWSAILAAAFLVLSSLAVFVVGWTGPPPTFNMAQKAMSGVEVRKTWVPLKDISGNLVRAVISSEDTRFCEHHGFDFEEIQNAMDEAQAGGRVRGASTISQQTAKNVFLFNGGGWVRKGFETWFTFLIEKMWSKARIMEIYLNVAEWGDGYYGAEAAAQARFKVSAKDLSSRQAALLAAVLPSPNRWKVTGNYAQQRAGKIQTVMGVVRRDALDRCAIGR
ncbi:MAG: monofunctional biosynthetic peptidoglycan transglycosylase [Alphaproteobacteria bacterium]|nr:monofunctional biosynthetic peptidoglycan transglycosylase [Alphaproteobacteria bacterium]